MLPQGGEVDATITAAGHANSLEFGLTAPVDVVVCNDVTGPPCFPPTGAHLGTFGAGTDLVFYLTDITCDETFVCPHEFSQVIQTSPTTWQVCFDDAGGGCVHHDPPCHCNVCADITLTPS